MYHNHLTTQRYQPTNKNYPNHPTDHLQITIETEVSSKNSPYHSPVNNHRKAEVEKNRKNRETKDVEKHRNNEPYLKEYHSSNISPISISTSIRENPHSKNQQINYSAKINEDKNENSNLYSFELKYNTHSPDTQITYEQEQEPYRSLKPKHIIKITDNQRANSPITLKRDEYENTSLNSSRINSGQHINKEKNIYSNMGKKGNEVSRNEKFGKSDMKETAYESERYHEDEEDYEDEMKVSNGIKKKQTHFKEFPSNNHKKTTNFQYQSLLTPPPKHSFSAIVPEMSSTPKNMNKTQTPKSSSQANTSFKSKFQFHSPIQENIDQSISITHHNQDQHTKDNILSNNYEILIEDGFSEDKEKQEPIRLKRRETPSPKKKLTGAMNKTTKISFKDHNSNTTIVIPLSRTETKLKDKYDEEFKQTLNKTLNHTHLINISKRSENSQLQNSRLERSRTLSRSKYSISPECQIITDRLHNSKINKQPCPRYGKYKEAMKRIKVKDGIEDYTFIRRYLSDDEIYDIMEELHEANVPQKKWPNKLVDIVYDKLRKGNI